MRGIGTTFADKRDLKKYLAAKAAGKSEQYALSVGDNGVGAPRLGGVSTPNAYGIAVPTSYLREHYGNDPANWRTARGNLTYGDTTVSVPYVDIGPGKSQRDKGVITDLTSPLAQKLGTDDYAKVTLEPSDTKGPDYKKDSLAWQEDQNRIDSELESQQMEPSPTPLSSMGGISTGLNTDDDLLANEIRKRQISQDLNFSNIA